MQKNIYFISDIHLGAQGHAKSLVREKHLVNWLTEIKPKTEALYLVGDVFDFWYEWAHVIPKYFTRFLAKIAEFTDEGIPVHFFTGNHDIWSFGYLEKELGVSLHRKPLSVKLGSKQFYIAHGDGLGPGDKLYKLMKWGFSNSVLQWLFSRIHPNFAMWVASTWSHSSRDSHTEYDNMYKRENEFVWQHSVKILEQEHHDYFVYGHRHISVKEKIADNSELVILGDWISLFSYAVFDGEVLEMKTFPISHF